MATWKTKLKYPDRKISEPFLLLAEPLLEAHGPNMTEAQMEQPLRIAWTVWKAVVYADAGKNGHMLDSVRKSMCQDPHVKGLVEGLIDRKRTAFGDDDRLIGDYTLFRRDGEIRLRAEAHDPTRKIQ